MELLRKTSTYSNSQAVGWDWPARCFPHVWIQKSALNNSLSIQTEMTWPHSADARPRIYQQTRNLTRMSHLPPRRLCLLTLSIGRLKHVGCVLTINMRSCSELPWWIVASFYFFEEVFFFLFCPLPLSLTQGEYGSWAVDAQSGANTLLRRCDQTLRAEGASARWNQGPPG